MNRHAAVLRSAFTLLAFCLGCLTTNSRASGQQQTSSQSVADIADGAEQQLKADVQRLEITQPTSRDYLKALDRLGRLYLLKGRLTEAEPILERALNVTSQVVAAPRDLRAQVYVDLGDLYHAFQQQQGSEPSWDRLAVIYYFRAAALLESSEDLAWANAAIKLATALSVNGRSKLDAPLVSYLGTLLERALAIVEPIEGADSSTAQLAMTDMVWLDKGSKGGTYQSRFCQTLESDNKRRPQLILACAAAVLEAGLPAQAFILARGALSAFARESEGEAVPEHVTALLVLAEATRRQGELNEADNYVNQALVLCNRYLGTSHWSRAEALMAKGRVSEGLKRKSESKQARREAAAIVSANKRGVATPRLANVKLIQKVVPNYTAEARSKNVEGSIVVLCEIGVDGRPSVLVTLNHLGFGLDQEALAAVLRWRFDPMRKDDQPVPSSATIEVNFKLI